MSYHNANNKQRKASNPEISAWVSASAGTGKTKILIDRLLRLLLNGVHIDNILCITYSRAASQEMINRLMNVLAQWSIMNENNLKESIHDISGEDPNDTQLTLARELFSTVINNANLLKIQTIHSFCQNLLSRFPIEADIPVNFLVIEEKTAQQLKEQAIEKVIFQKIQTAQSDEKFEKSLQTLIDNVSQFTFEDIVKNILNYAEKIELITLRYNTDISSETLKQEIYKYLNANINIDSNILIKNYFANINKIDLLQCIEILEDNNIELKRLNIQKLKAFLQQKTNDFNLWKTFFLNQEDKIPKNHLVNKQNQQKLQNNCDFIINTINNITQELVEFIDQYKNQVSAEVNTELINISILIYKKYQQIKKDNGYLDYNDLIMKTYELINKQGLSDWIMYKVDHSIDHILVDEAQDTSPMQWEIIKTLTQEFFSGSGSRNEVNRTIFVVGDIKQSIYSFQGADPHFFNKTKEFLKNKILNANKVFEQIPMNTSFRSSKGVIDMINHVTNNLFDTSTDPYTNENIYHEVFHENKTCRVDLWPIIHIDKDEDKNKDDKYKDLAKAIVKQIKYLHHNDNINFGDILILYRKRKNNITLEYIVKLLKDNNIPVLGIDKINLKNNIAILDLIALARFLNQTMDSFSLCCVLKSPIFNLNDEDIFNIVHYDKEKTVFFNLQHTHSDIYKVIKSWLSLVNVLNVFDLFFHIIYHKSDSNESNLTKFIKRLGMDVIDPISEFMNLIVSFTSDHEDNLHTFINFIEEYTHEISREVTNQKNAVNLMSIHSSKGLQSKVVFVLNDLDHRSPNKTILFNNNIEQPLLIFSPKTDIKCKAIENLILQSQKAELEESKRLLYVGITRAEEQLYIASISNYKNIQDKKKVSHVWWYALSEGIENVLEKKKDSFFSKDLGFVSEYVWRIENFKKTVVKKENDNDINIPHWIYKNPPKEPSPSKPLSPSDLGDQEKYFRSPLSEINLHSKKVMKKGIILHSLLEKISYIDLSDHEDFIKNFINLQTQISNQDKEDIKTNIYNIINNDKFQWIFNKNSLNEVSISGSVIDNTTVQMISARIDKLIIEKNEIIIIDYKYSEKTPIISNNHKRQIQLYKNLLQSIYTDHTVKGFIFFSYNAQIIEV